MEWNKVQLKNNKIYTFTFSSNFLLVDLHQNLFNIEFVIPLVKFFFTKLRHTLSQLNEDRLKHNFLNCVNALSFVLSHKFDFSETKSKTLNLHFYLICQFFHYS